MEKYLKSALGLLRRCENDGIETLTLPVVIVTCHTAANSDESYIDCQTHAAREVANVLSGKGPTTEIKDPWLLAEAQEEGFGGV